MAFGIRIRGGSDRGGGFGVSGDINCGEDGGGGEYSDGGGMHDDRGQDVFRVTRTHLQSVYFLQSVRCNENMMTGGFENPVI